MTMGLTFYIDCEDGTTSHLAGCVLMRLVVNCSGCRIMPDGAGPRVQPNAKNK